MLSESIWRFVFKMMISRVKSAFFNGQAFLLKCIAATERYAVERLWRSRFRSVAIDIGESHKQTSVACCGCANAGKSALLNALLEDDVLPSGAVATTRCMCHLHHSTLSFVAWRTGKDVPEACSLVFEKLALQCNLVSMPGENDNVRFFVGRKRRVSALLGTIMQELSLLMKAPMTPICLTLGIPFPLELRQFSLIDLPSVDFMNNDELALNAGLSLPDVVLYVLDAEQVGRRDDEQTLQRLRTMKKGILLVMNKADTLPENYADVSAEETQRLFGMYPLACSAALFQASLQLKGWFMSMTRYMKAIKHLNLFPYVQTVGSCAFWNKNKLIKLLRKESRRDEILFRLVKCAENRNTHTDMELDKFGPAIASPLQNC